MNLKDYLSIILPRLINFKMARAGIVKPGNPLTVTFSVTAACNSRCKTCYIGDHFAQDPQRVKDDLRLEEIEKIFRSLGPVYFFNISGGEPFLRNDYCEIIDLARRHLKPKIIHTPTNALLPSKIHRHTKQCLEAIQKSGQKIEFSVKPSIDGVGDRHDEIRGVPGNFAKLEDTIQLLKGLEQDYPFFHLELGTVVSRFNIDHLEEIEDYVHAQGVQSYRNEIAEQREEFFNTGENITPTFDEYEQLMNRFKEKIRENIIGKKKLTRITEALRLVYYDLATEIMRTGTQAIPCYAGLSNVHINYNGDVWPCCVLGYKKPLGNLRDANYDFHTIWHSKQADEVRSFIKKGGCACPLANQAYSNILCSPKQLIKVTRNLFAFYRKNARSKN
jgi:MoaA/NifB/PqqE/SkfB family radical SAM enzyme